MITYYILSIGYSFAFDRMGDYYRRFILDLFSLI
ncbi:unnamed protein product, partial [marine sediment metagenome]